MSADPSPLPSDTDDAFAAITGHEAPPAQPFVPPAARQLLDELGKHDLAATCVQTSRGFTVVLQTDRVRATAVFRRGSSGWRHTSGALTVDGVHCPTARTIGELARIVADPTKHALGAASKTERDMVNAARPCAVPARTDPVPDDADVPHSVREVAHVLTARVPGTVVIEHPDRFNWHVRLTGDAESLVVVFVKRRAAWGVRHIALVNLAGDSATDIGGSIEEALKALNKSDAPAPDTAGGHARRAPRTKNDALTAKTNIVVRT
jgi:hypothetical protein